MRTFLTLAVLAVLHFSCAHGQKAVLPEARQKVAVLKPLLGLSYEQVKKMEDAESSYLKLCKTAAGDEAKRQRANALRSSSLQRILSREQFVKFQAIENKRIKPVPLRS
ncbi:hypothetical protein [Niabella hirudinis]|uniref:hypothetical protein n=1 Tax=Niabella hirudinis TaxID=1285929 RepID=UPI003EBEB3E3